MLGYPIWMAVMICIGLFFVLATIIYLLTEHGIINRRTAGILADVIATARETGAVREQIDPAVTADLVGWGGERTMSRHVATSLPETDADCARKLAVSISAMLFVEQ